MTNRAHITIIVTALTVMAACQREETRPTVINVQLSEPDAAIVKIGDKDVQLSEILKKAEPQTVKGFQQYANAMFDLKEKLAEEFVRNYMIEQEAKSKGMSVERFKDKYVYGGKLTPDKDKVEQLAKQWPAAPRAKIEEMLLNQQRSEKAAQYLASLENKYPYQMLLSRPPVNFDLSSSPSQGPANAAVTLVEFSDFECPFCSRFSPTMKQVLEKYGDRVRRVWKNFPLPIHSKASLAANAALCANDQGKFWEYHDQLFTFQQNLERNDLIKYANEIKLNADKFFKCLDSGKYKAQVSRDMEEAESAGVRGTPALFVNGKLISGAQSVDAVSKIIDQELHRRQGKQGASPNY